MPWRPFGRPNERSARGARPAGRVRHLRRHGACGARRLVRPRTRQDAGHRRRIRLRQVRHRAEHHGPRPDAAGQDHRRRGDAGRPRHPARPEDRRQGHPRPAGGHDLPGPDVLPEPHHDHRRPDRRDPSSPPPLQPSPGVRPRRRAHRDDAHSRSDQTRQAVSVRVLRRHAATGDDRHVAGLRTVDSDRGRTHHRAGRDHPGADPGPDGRLAARDRHGHRAHHPRSRRRGAHGGRRAGDVRRRGGGARQRGPGVLPLRPPVHAGPEGGDAVQPAGRRADPDAHRPPPAGCGYFARCPEAMRVCGDGSPPAFGLGEGHHARCWLHHEDCPRRPAEASGA